MQVLCIKAGKSQGVNCGTHSPRQTRAGRQRRKIARRRGAEPLQDSINENQRTRGRDQGNPQSGHFRAGKVERKTFQRLDTHVQDGPIGERHNIDPLMTHPKRGRDKPLFFEQPLLTDSGQFSRKAIHVLRT